MKHGKPVLQSTRLLDQVRERIRYLHYSLSTEKVYLYWVHFFVLWHGRTARIMHPRDMGAKEWSALSALPFLYREVLSRLTGDTTLADCIVVLDHGRLVKEARIYSRGIVVPGLGWAARRFLQQIS